ncbi:MAG: hypothetical protein FWE10_03585 [Rikenellaceae bacterium]|nr:hypothetical protein [Rikenellaceae bacterium]MCL2693032.1 hypothetical protein [Rikenellaceae bacterium]
MKDYEFGDRTIDSTDNNEYADGERDETLWDTDIVDTEVPVDDAIPDALDEYNEGSRPLYSEDGFRKNIGE